jgi:hypothetical protein
VAPDFNPWANSEKNPLFYPLPSLSSIIHQLQPIQTVKASPLLSLSPLPFPDGFLKIQPRERLKIGSKRTP